MPPLRIESGRRLIITGKVTKPESINIGFATHRLKGGFSGKYVTGRRAKSKSFRYSKSHCPNIKRNRDTFPESSRWSRVVSMYGFRPLEVMPASKSTSVELELSEPSIDNVVFDFGLCTSHMVRAASRLMIRQSILPARYAEEHFVSLTEKSPFTRMLNLSDTLVLSGIAKVDGLPCIDHSRYRRRKLVSRFRTNPTIAAGEPWKSINRTSSNQPLRRSRFPRGEIIRVQI